jgi:hypothetical protein
MMIGLKVQRTYDPRKRSENPPEQASDVSHIDGNSASSPPERSILPHNPRLRSSPVDAIAPLLITDIKPAADVFNFWINDEGYSVAEYFRQGKSIVPCFFTSK